VVPLGAARPAPGAPRRASEFRYVFIGGLGGERMPGYFEQNARELRRLGVPRRSIHTIRPSSRRTVEQNREEVRAAILAAAESGPQRLVIIGHSRGACDAAAFALHEPGFVRDRVEALFLVQGPFGGSALADYVLGEGRPMDGRMPPGHRLVAYLLAKREGSLVGRGVHSGLTGLTRAASRAYWHRELDRNAEAARAVGPRIFYVESRARPSGLRLFQRATHRYLGTYYGPSDGMVGLEDQSLPGLGTRLGPVEAGHADLTRRSPASRGGRQSRAALVRAIVMTVGGGGGRPEG
jgi:pimeloyl-ACP methyl ester carboxylesterase